MARLLSNSKAVSSLPSLEISVNRSRNPAVGFVLGAERLPDAHACTKKLASEFLIGVLLRVNFRQIFEWRREVRKVEGTDHSYDLGFAYSGGGVGQELNSTPSSGIGLLLLGPRRMSRPRSAT